MLIHVTSLAFDDISAFIKCTPQLGVISSAFGCACRMNSGPEDLASVLHLVLSFAPD